MIYEVAAAVDHVVSLVQKGVGAEALAGFSSTLKDELETRCQACWVPTDSEYGSAKRAVHWQMHAAGEGPDSAILSAISLVLVAHPEFQADMPSHTTRHQQALALALQWLPHSFTLWIDPGCVAVRNGTGPGCSSTFFDANVRSNNAPWSSSVKVVWGTHSAFPQQSVDVPRLSVSSIQFPTTLGKTSRPIPIVRPTAQHNRSSSRIQDHQRTVSSCSTASSESISAPSPSLTRSISLSSTSTVSTEATSCSSISLASNHKDKDNGDADVDSDAVYCPNLTSPYQASSISSCIDDQADADDTTVGNITATPFSSARLIHAITQVDQDDVGDVTLDATNRPLLAGLQPSANIAISSTPKPLGKKLPSTKLPGPVPTKSNYTTHDNGNVGVLGGGVRLGGGSSKSFAPTQGAVPRYRQHSHSQSLSHVQPPLFPPQQQHCFPPQYYHMNAGNYSVPARTVPLPSTHLVHQHHVHMPMRPPMQLSHYGSVPHLAKSYNEHAFSPYQGEMRALGGTTVSFALPPQSELMGEDGNGDGRRRVRSRGRRSRGRGAGRAARRQAAALRAVNGDSDDLNLAELDDLDLDCDSDAQLTDADSNYSRCSTPATTTSSSSEYQSSCFSSPVKVAPRNAARFLPHLPTAMTAKLPHIPPLDIFL